MDLSPDSCERARLSRDARFDGRFFVAVLSTRIFCRPTCPVQPPRAENVRFYASPVAALEAGFRPCLRCLPELAPGLRPSPTAGDRVAEALRLIDEGFLDRHDSAALAAQLRLTSRHLGRLFRDRVGASPARVAQARRLLFAKHLLDQSRLSVTDIAFAAGFGSLRRFNTVVKATWGRSPGQLRRQPAAPGPIRLDLGYRPPLDWFRLLGFFRDRAIPGVERIDQDRYYRRIRLNGEHGWLMVRAADRGNALTLEAALPSVRHLGELVSRVRRMFDLDADLMSVGRVLGEDPLLAPVLKRVPGLRVPGAWDPFEVAVRAILGQQVSVAAARTLATRLVHRFGEAVESDGDGGVALLFPTPGDLQSAELESLGVTRARADAIRRLSAEVVAGRVDFRAPDLVSRLVVLPGIGDWTAQYISLRSGHDPDAFPAADLGLLRGAEVDQAMTPARLRRRADNWRPWRAYAALCLWARYAEGKEEA